jgi:hypothetical protein
LIDFYTETCIVIDMTIRPAPLQISITDAGKRGVSSLARAAELGSSFLVERRHTPVAAVIGADRLFEYQEAERDLRDLSLVMVRFVSDNGHRTSLDDVFSRFGFDRETLQKELDEDLAAGRE